MMASRDAKKSFLDSIKPKRRPLSLSLSINNIHARYLDKRSSVYFDKENDKALAAKPVAVTASASGHKLPTLKARKRLSMVSLRSLRPDSSDSDTDSALDTSPFTPAAANTDAGSINLTSIESSDLYDIPSSKRVSNASEIGELVHLVHSLDLLAAYSVACDPRSVAQESQSLLSFNTLHSYGARLVENALFFSFETPADTLDLDNIDYASVLKNDPYTLE